MEAETLYIGEEAVLPVSGVRDGAVYVGIRPEGFVPSETGAFTCTLGGMEVMGRDVSILASHTEAQTPKLRAIVSAEFAIDLSKQTVRFDLKPAKVFLFDTETEERLRFSV